MSWAMGRDSRTSVLNSRHRPFLFSPRRSTGQRARRAGPRTHIRYQYYITDWRVVVSTKYAPWSLALVILKALQREAAVTPRCARGHGHRDEGGLRDLGVRSAGSRRLLRVRFDAPGTLRDLRDAERDELLGLAGNRAILEGFLVELEEGPVRLRHELPHPLELSLHVDAVEYHHGLLAQ